MPPYLTHKLRSLTRLCTSRRDLICSVFGLLSMIGRAAETARREDEEGRPLPTSDLMGYAPLGIVFGPLLVGDMLDNYTLRLANPHGGLVLLPVSPPKPRKDRHKKSRTSDNCNAFNQHVDKLKIANGVTEMLITHWRDVVRMLKDLKVVGALGINRPLVVHNSKKQTLRPSASEPFILRKPPNWDGKMIQPSGPVSPTPAPQEAEKLVVKKQRSRLGTSHQSSTSRLTDKLSPTMEEGSILSRPRPSAYPRLKEAKSLIMLGSTKEEFFEAKIPTGPSNQKLQMKESTSLISSTIEERLALEEVRISIAFAIQVVALMSETYRNRIFREILHTNTGLLLFIYRLGQSHLLTNIVFKSRV